MSENREESELRRRHITLSDKWRVFSKVILSESPHREAVYAYQDEVIVFCKHVQLIEPEYSDS